MNVGSLLAHHARYQPDKLAVVCGAQRLSFGELHSRVNRLSNALLRLGLRKGDKLAIILPNTDLPGAQVVAEVVRERIEALAIRHGASAFGHVAVSVGAACMAGSYGEGSERQLIEAADRMLYRAKASGRNRVETGADRK